MSISPELPPGEARRLPATRDWLARLLSVIACRYLQSRGHFNVGRIPTDVSTRPLSHFQPL